MSQNLTLLEHIEQAIASLEVALPARNQTAVQLQELLTCGEYDIQQVLDLVASDQALTAEILRVANSSFYGGLSEITTVQNAVVRIGGPEVVRLAIAATEKKSYQVNDPGLAAHIVPLWQHAMGVALGARWLARKLGFQALENEAFIAGLLHDVGKLLLIKVCDDLMTSERIGRDIPEPVIQEVLETGHCRHGAALLEHWGLPDAYRVIVLGHHDDLVNDQNTLLLLVRLADLACRSLGVGMNSDASLNLAATEEAHALDIRDVMLAELSIMLEDSFSLV